MRLADPEPLLLEWGNSYSYRKNSIREFYSLRSVSEIESRIAEMLPKKGIRYALTGFSGADRLAPYARYHKVTAYVDETDEDLASVLDLKKVTSGANVSLLTPYDNGVFYGSRDLGGCQVASPIQVYLDLYGDLGRGKRLPMSFWKG